MAITDFDQQQADLRERRKRAREGQQFNAIPGQMVSGHYVAPHFTQVLAEGLRGYNAIQGEKQADQELKDLTSKRETAITDNRRAYIDALRGTDEKRDISFADPEMMGPQQTVTPAVAPDPMRAYEIAMESPDSAMRTAGTTQFNQFQQAEAERQRKLAETQAAEQQAQAKQAQLSQLWQQSGGDAQAFLAATGGSADGMNFAKTMVEGASLGKPTVVRTVETVDGRGRPVTQGYDANNNPVGPAIPKYVAPKAPSTGPAAPAGYRYKADGSLEAIPGGPADIKAGELGIKRERQQQGAVAQADRIIGKVDQALSKVGLNTTGIGGAVMRSIPGTEAKNLESDLETIKANLGFAELQAMRDASPTGGALGAIAVQELVALQSTVASLDQAQDSAQLKARLGEIRTHYENWKNAVTQASGGQAPSATPQRTVTRTGTVNGRKVVQYSDGTTEYAD